MINESEDSRRMSSSSVASHHEAPPPTPIPTNVQVSVRCRPLNLREKTAGRGAVVHCKPHSNELTIVKRKTYAFDRVFGQYSTQKDVFNAVVRPAVDEALSGYNCTVFAYGQTGTGKTYTMQGDLSPDSDAAGIIPRSVRCIFDSLEASGEEFSVRVSFLQLYNEELKDLLDPDTDKKLRLLEDAKRSGIYCANLLEVTATTAQHVYELVNTGVKNRITSETLMNENSSRSHSIFTIRIHSKEHNRAGEDLLRVGQLNLVDLAGSECVGRSGARNARAREAGTINQSLLTLGRVITALVDNLPHVPYRDSKLTRLLQESLGGRAKTTIIATLAPCADSLDETLSTLDYAFRAKHIKNRPELNQRMTKAGLLNDFESEIETLRDALRAARLKDGVYLPLEQFTDMQERLAGQSVQLAELEEMLESKHDICKQLEEVAEKNASDVAALSSAKQEVLDKLVATEGELGDTKEALAKATQDLQQARGLLKAYQDNEPVLLANGATAAKLYSDSEERANRLFEKIEQTQHTEETNAALAVSYREDTRFQITAFIERLEVHKKSQEILFNDVANSLSELQSSHSTDLDGLVSCLNALQALVEARETETTALLTSDMNRNSGQREKLTALMKQKQRGIQQRLKALIEISKSYATAMTEDLTKSKLRNTTFIENIQSALEMSREDLSSFLTEQGNRLLELQHAIGETIEDQKNIHGENKEAITALMKSSHDQQQEMLRNMKYHLCQFLDKCIENQTQCLREETMLIEENATKEQQHLSHVKAISKQGIQNFMCGTSTFNLHHGNGTAGFRHQLSELRKHLNETNGRQSQLAQLHRDQQATWSGDTAAFADKHTEEMGILMDKYALADAEASSERRKQLAQFASRYEELRHTLFGGCKKLNDRLQTQLSHTKIKVESASESGKAVIGEATDASIKQLHNVETFVKKRQVNTPTGCTPTKTEGCSFPSFEATKASLEQLQYTLSCANHLSNEAIAGQKRRRSSDLRVDIAKGEIENTTEHANNVIGTENSPVISSEDPVSACSEPSARGIAKEPCRDTAIANSSQLRFKNVEPVGLQRKKARNTNVPVAGSRGARQVAKASELAAPKRYRAKWPLGETTNLN